MAHTRHCHGLHIRDALHHRSDCLGREQVRQFAPQDEDRAPGQRLEAGPQRRLFGEQLGALAWTGVVVTMAGVALVLKTGRKNT